MSALPVDHPIADQDHAHSRVRALLDAVTTAVLTQQPALTSFADHRPERDRPSGGAWRGLETMCHVSALLASRQAPDLTADGAQRVLDSAHSVARAWGLDRRSDRDDHGIRTITWTNAAGELLEVIVGVRVAVRAISAPFLPGSLHPAATTSPQNAQSAQSSPNRLSPLSPFASPARRVR